jgi:hypothetical protein
MTASPGREVDGNLLRSAAPGCTQARTNAQDASGQDLGDLAEALGRSHEVGRKAREGADVAFGHVRSIPAAGWSCSLTTLEPSTLYREAPIHAVARPLVQSR